MFGFKKLLKRIKSIEECLGINYIPGDNKTDDYAMHAVSNNYGRIYKLDRIKELKKEELSVSPVSSVNYE